MLFSWTYACRGWTDSKRRRMIVADQVLNAIRIVILSTFDLDEYVFEALRVGASGFLVKNTEPAELVHAVRAVAAGDALYLLAYETTGGGVCRAREADRDLQRSSTPSLGASGRSWRSSPKASNDEIAADSCESLHRQDPCQPSNGQARRQRSGAAGRACLRVWLSRARLASVVVYRTSGSPRRCLCFPRCTPSEADRATTSPLDFETI